MAVRHPISGLSAAGGDADPALREGRLRTGTRAVARFAGWLALAYALALALALPFLWGAFADSDAPSLAGAFIAATWTASPVVAAAGFAGASPTRRWAFLFLALELVLISSFAWELVQVSFVQPSSTGGMVFLSWPLLQWAAIAVAFPITLALGWRMRPDFLKG